MGEYVYMFVRLLSLTSKLACSFNKNDIYLLPEHSKPAWSKAFEVSFPRGYWKYDAYHRILPMETMYNFCSSCTPR